MNRPASKLPPAWIALDGGSTNTRVWLVREGRVAARASAGVGVRDSARAGSTGQLRAGVRDLIAAVRASQPQSQPSLVAAAGMITSPLGLAGVPHVAAPAAAEDLARGARSLNVADITDLPFWLFPGVRCGDLSSDEVSRVDVMRGEETLCVGLLADERHQPPFTVLNLGSHWKWIRVDGAGRIAQSRTSLTGELIHATQTATILAGGLPAGKLEQLDDSWCAKGMNEMRRSGLARAIFCVRLLEMQGRTTPQERMSFLIGAYVAAEVDALPDAQPFGTRDTVILAGADAVAQAWRIALDEKNLPARPLAQGEIETAFLSGLSRLVRTAAGSG